MVGFHSLTPVGGLYEGVCVFKYVCVLFIYFVFFILYFITAFMMSLLSCERKRLNYICRVVLLLW